MTAKNQGDHNLEQLIKAVEDEKDKITLRQFVRLLGIVSLGTYFSMFLIIVIVSQLGYHAYPLINTPRFQEASAYYEVTIVDVEEELTRADFAIFGGNDVKQSDVFNARLVLDQSVPNDYGTLMVELPDRSTVSLAIRPVSFHLNNKDRKHLEEGDQTKELLTQLMPKRQNITARDLKSREGRFYSDHYLNPKAK